jgi:PAS domain S-box-containing protein
LIERDLDEFLYANKALLNLWGLTLDEAIEKNFFDLKYPDDLAVKLQGQIQQVCASRESLSDETEYISPSGVAGHYEYIFSPVLGADGTVEAVAGSTREITERKRAEAELIEAKRAAEFANQSKDRFPEKGTIRVTTAPEAHGRWEMRVRDSGMAFRKKHSGASSTPLNKQAQTSPANSVVSVSDWRFPKRWSNSTAAPFGRRAPARVTVPPSSSIYPTNYRNNQQLGSHLKNQDFKRIPASLDSVNKDRPEAYFTWRPKQPVVRG